MGSQPDESDEQLVTFDDYRKDYDSITSPKSTYRDSVDDTEPTNYRLKVRK